MKIKDIGGEFALIKRLTKVVKDKNIIKGIGDDAAVIKVKDKYLVITTDTLVEGDHFSFKWFTAKQVGKKAIEINVSDIGAMGAVPKYALVSLVLPVDMDVKVVDEIYKGMWGVGKKYKIGIIGGNVTHGKQLVIDIDMIGKARKENLKFRSNAKPGDFILVSGDLGSSVAGLNLFIEKFIKNKKINLKKYKKILKKHLEPEAKFYKVRKFLKYINAMIDVSDGLASDITRICEQSKVGAVIFKDNIPIAEETRKAAKVVGKDALAYALYGGEDFELVYTVSEKNLSKVKGFLVGEITRKKVVRIYSKGKERLITKHGYDHFLG